MAKKDENKLDVRTPWGKLSFPYLHKIDEGRKYSSGKYSADLFMTKEDMQKEDGIALINAVLQVGRKALGNDDADLGDIYHPFKFTNDFSEAKRDKLPEQVQENHVLIKCNSKFKVSVLGPEGTEESALSDDEIAELNGGDICRFVVTVYSYPKEWKEAERHIAEEAGQTLPSVGVTCGLTMVQFRQKGKSFGQGKAAAINMLDAAEVKASDIKVSAEPGAKKTDAASLFG